MTAQRKAGWGCHLSQVFKDAQIAKVTEQYLQGLEVVLGHSVLLRCEGPFVANTLPFLFYLILSIFQSPVQYHLSCSQGLHLMLMELTTPPSL
jgi:hypothetical protein